jgi:hypothetical protein
LGGWALPHPRLTPFPLGSRHHPTSLLDTVTVVVRFLTVCRKMGNELFRGNNQLFSYELVKLNPSININHKSNFTVFTFGGGVSLEKEKFKIY